MQKMLALDTSPCICQWDWSRMKVSGQCQNWELG